MLIVDGHKSYISKEDKLSLPNVTASTREEAFRLLLTTHNKQFMQVFMTNSWEKWRKNSIDMEDAVAEFFAAMSEWPEDAFVAKFNEREFNFFLVRYCKRHLCNYGTFHSKYDPLHSVTGATQLEMDAEDTYFDLQEPMKEERHQLSITQYVDLIGHYLRSQEFLARFHKHDLDFFYENFILPYLTDGKPKRIFIKHVALEQGLAYKPLLKRMIPIRNRLQKRLPPFIPYS